MGAFSFLTGWIEKQSNSRLFLVLAVGLLLLCLPRFNGNTILVKQVPWDAHYFEAYVEYFRGEVPQAPIRPASNWRFLLPLMASVLPFDAATSLNLVNLVFLAAAAWLVYKIIFEQYKQRSHAWMAGFLFVFSFPVFYYGCISYTDPGSVFFVCLGVYLWLDKKTFGFILALIIGIMAKETVALLLPFIFIHSVRTQQIKNLILSVLAIGIYVAEVKLIREYAPLSLGETRYTFWNISTASFMHNLGRWHTWGAWLLTMGIPGILLVKKLSNTRGSFWFEPIPAAALASILAAQALFLFSFISTVADGRIVWHSYIYMLLIIFADKSTRTRESIVSGKSIENIY